MFAILLTERTETRSSVYYVRRK